MTAQKDAIRRTGKLLRHRRFAEQKAESVLQVQRKELVSAHEALDAAYENLDAASLWKARLLSGTHMDLEIYQQTLRHELLKTLAVTGAQESVSNAEAHVQEAAAAHQHARSNSRVADARLSRISRQWDEAQERSESDQLAYLWLTAQGRAR